MITTAVVARVGTAIFHSVNYSEWYITKQPNSQYSCIFRNFASCIKQPDSRYIFIY